LSYTSIALALIASFTVYFRPQAHSYLKAFPVFLVIIAILGGVIGYLSVHAKSNIILFNVFSIFAFCFYFFVLSQIIVNKKLKKLILFIMFLYPVFAFLNTVIIQKITVFHTRSYSIGCLLIVAFCIYYFYELFQLPRAINLLKETSFWICSGLLFYYACSFPLFGFINSLKNPSLIIITHLDVILNLLDVFLYSSFTIAFLCRIKIRKFI
jgi:hypothetical protein